MIPLALVHQIWGYSLEDWVAILTILAMIAGGFRWLGKRSKKAVDNIEHNVLGPIYDELSKLNHNMQISNQQHERDQKRLENGDRKFFQHDQQLKDHERRIVTLERKNNK